MLLFFSIFIAILVGIAFGYNRYGPGRFCMIRNVLFGACGALTANAIATSFHTAQQEFLGMLFISIMGSLIALALTDVFRLW